MRILLILLLMACGSNIQKKQINDGIALCGSNFHDNLRDCNTSTCKVDFTEILVDAYNFKDYKNPYLYTEIKKENGKCLTRTYSSFDGEKSCQFDLLFNKYFQKSAKLLSNKDYILDQHKLNSRLSKIENEKDYLDWMTEYNSLYKKYDQNPNDIRKFNETYPDAGEIIKKSCSVNAAKTNEEISYKKAAEAYKLKLQKEQFRISKLDFKKIKEFQSSMYDVSEKYLSECKAGNVNSCKEVASYFSYQGDYENAAFSYEKACNLGDIPSCTNASYNFHVTKLPAKAQIMAKKACSGREPIGCYNVACFACRKNNVSEALKYFKTARSVDLNKDLIKIKQEVLDDPEIQCIRETPEFQAYIKEKL